jgi:hypothetical protein
LFTPPFSLCRLVCRSACGIHVVEAIVAARCATALKLPTAGGVGGWFALTLLGGNGTLQRAQALAAAQEKTPKTPPGHKQDKAA